MGMRGQRFAIVVDDGVATHVAVKRPGSSKSARPRQSSTHLVTAHVGSSRVLSASRHSGDGSLNRSATRPMSATLENRRFFVLVDRDDRAGILDTGQVLNRPGYADRDIQIRAQ